MFASAVDIVRLMQLSAHLPPLLVVGIGYRLAGLDETVLVRTRDFTPTADPKFARWFPDHTMMGGAGNFLAFIRDELQPWVHSHYPVDPDDSMYFGHSFGGLFATYVLLTEPGTFRRYGIGSPSLWWHDDMMFPYEQRYADAHVDLAAKVFFSVGAFEDHDGRQREAIRSPSGTRAGRQALHRHGRRHTAHGRTPAQPELREPRDRQRGDTRRVPHHRAARQSFTLTALPFRRSKVRRSPTAWLSRPGASSGTLGAFGSSERRYVMT